MVACENAAHAIGIRGFVTPNIWGSTKPRVLTDIVLASALSLYALSDYHKNIHCSEC